MNSQPPAPPRTKRRARLSPLTVIGEFLIIGGLGVFGYIVWQPWHTAVEVTAHQTERSAAISAQWRNDPVSSPGDGTVPVTPRPAIGDVFGVLHVPAFGTTFANPIAEGTGWWETLNYDDKGIGHYPSSPMPGEGGNVAIAAHRSGGFITPFREVMELRVGDPVFLETADGWYTYRFRSIEYVLPDAGEVLFPFPNVAGDPGDVEILTMTTCHPKMWGSDERAIAYSVFEGFQPHSAGPPAELLALNPALQGGAA